MRRSAKPIIIVSILSATLPGMSAALAQQALPGLVVQGAALEAPAATPAPAAAKPDALPAPRPKPLAKAPVEQPVPKAAARPAPAAPAPKAVAAAPAPKPPASASATAAANTAPGSAPSSGSNESAGASSVTNSGTTSGTSSGGIAADKVGSNVTVVTGQDLKNQQIRNGADALRSLPGVSVSRSGSAAGVTQVRIRGAEGNQTLVLIDGIVANSGIDGEFDFSDLSADDIEQIEVIRGNQSGLYGSNAMGGVINIITKGGSLKQGGGPLTVTAKVEGGSFRTRDVSAGISGGNDKGYVAVAGHVRESAGFNVSPQRDPGAPGFSDKEDSRLASFSVKVGGKIADTGRVDVVVKTIDKSGGRDGFGGNGPLLTAVDDASKFSSNIWLAGVNLRYDMLDGALTHVVRANHNSTLRIDDDRSAFGPFHSESRSISDKIGYLVTYRFQAPLVVAAKHSISGLIERELETFQPRSDFTTGEDYKRQRTGTVAEYRGEFADRLFVTGNVRRDTSDRFRDFVTWRTTAAVKLPELNMRPHASAGTGVKVPAFFELYGSIPAFFIANPNLKSETSVGWDAGVEFTGLAGRASVDVTYFRSDLTNKIDALPNSYPYNLYNLAGVSQRQGVEVAGRFKASSQLTLGANYTYLDAVDANGRREIRRPPHSGRVDANYAFLEGLANVNLAVSYNGQMRDNALDVAYTTVPVNLKAYTLVNLGGSYKLQPGVEMFGRVENLLNQKYQEIYGYNTPGATAFAGMRFTHVVKPLD
jgi:vitamin B12 transporter